MRMKLLTPKMKMPLQPAGCKGISVNALGRLLFLKRDTDGKNKLTGSRLFRDRSTYRHLCL